MDGARRLTVLFATVLVLAATAAAGPGDVTVDPAEVTVGLFFHGREVRVSAPLAGADRAVFLLLGPERDLSLKVKGKVGGALWASVGEVHFSHVPTLMLVRGGPEMPSDAALADAGLTPESLRATILGEDPEEMEELAFGEMLRLNESRGIYSVEEGATSIEADRAATTFVLPPDLPAGELEVRVTRFAGDRVLGEDRATLLVRRSAAVEGITRLSREHGFWYGLIAIVVAVLTGIATGFFFGRRGRRKG